jgi:hypothetical protein
MSDEQNRTESLTWDEWVDRLDGYIESRHATLFGRHMSVSDPAGRRLAAEWYADLIMRASSGDFEAQR